MRSRFHPRTRGCDIETPIPQPGVEVIHAPAGCDIWLLSARCPGTSFSSTQFAGATQPGFPVAQPSPVNPRTPGAPQGAHCSTAPEPSTHPRVRRIAANRRSLRWFNPRTRGCDKESTGWPNPGVNPRTCGCDALSYYINRTRFEFNSRISRVRR